MTPDNREAIAAVLSSLARQGARFPNRTQLSEHVAERCRVSARTARRAFAELDVSALIGQALTDENAGLPGAGQLGQPISDSSDNSDSPERETPGHEPDVDGASRERTPAQSPATPSAAAAAAAARSTPAPVGVPVRPARSYANDWPGHCVECAEWVVVGAGRIPTPYDEHEITPLHCAPCWSYFSAVDRVLVETVRASEVAR